MPKDPYTMEWSGRSDDRERRQTGDDGDGMSRVSSGRLSYQMVAYQPKKDLIKVITLTAICLHQQSMNDITSTTGWSEPLRCLFGIRPVGKERVH